MGKVNIEDYMFWKMHHSANGILTAAIDTILAWFAACLWPVSSLFPRHMLQLPEV